MSETKKLTDIQKQILKSNRRYCANCKTNMHSTAQCYYRNNNNNNQRTNNRAAREQIVKYAVDQIKHQSMSVTL
uniref:Uncharacterized protein n=1 Tax=Romanomermis culicivorax TaxID=13658 RepID=A0A915J6E6_ROMCU